MQIKSFGHILRPGKRHTFTIMLNYVQQDLNEVGMKTMGYVSYMAGVFY